VQSSSAGEADASLNHNVCMMQTWLFEPQGDPHTSSRQPKHGCSDCLQEGWDKFFSSVKNTLFVALAAFKIVSEMTCAGHGECSQMKSCFSIR